MPFSYHPPTTTQCEVCEKIKENDKDIPIISTYKGKASSTNGYPFHDWYNFVLGFTPTFPEYILEQENVVEGCGKVILDPFCGSGTTQLVCKLKELESYGIDANDFMVFAANEKLDWDIDINVLKKAKEKIDSFFDKKISCIDWKNNEKLNTMANDLRPEALDARYISDKPLIKISILKDAINALDIDDKYKDLCMFAVSAILVPVSNVRYGPGFGVGKIKEDANVCATFDKKLETMIRDLSGVTDIQKKTKSQTVLGDSRNLSEYFKPESVDLMITSPPYPGDHEYTKHSKLELIFQGYATDVSSFRTIKKRMLRGSTTNIYKEDDEKKYVENISEIKAVTDEIDHRLKRDNATSGFEKLYTKLVWEYFGGMAKVLRECYKVLKPGGKIFLLVSDSHAFKMVHIKTAELLKIVGEQEGFINTKILLWQMKPSTSHKYLLRENCLILQKPTP